MSSRKLTIYLFRAIDLRDMNKIHKILSKHPELLNVFNSRDEAVTPLWKALLMGQVQVVQMFIEFGANPNEKCKMQGVPYTDYTFFQYVASSSYSLKKLQLAQVLIRYGADVNTPQVESPFLISLKKNNLRFAQFLMENGVKFDPTYHNDNGENLLHIFIGQKDDQHDVVETVDILIKCGVAINEFSYGPMPHTPLFRAIIRRNKKLVALLLKRGADVNVSDPKGNTALHIACGSVCKNINIVRLLIQNGADIDAKDLQGNTPFFKLFKFSRFDSKNVYCKALTVMTNEISRLDYENFKISEENLNLISGNPEIHNYFEKCKSELEQMTSTVFYGTHSYYSVLKMSKNIKQLAKMTENSEFVREFENNLFFPCYGSDLQWIFKEAIKLRDEKLTVNSRLSSIFGNIFPEIVLNKLVDSLEVEDLLLDD